MEWAFGLQEILKSQRYDHLEVIGHRLFRNQPANCGRVFQCESRVALLRVLLELALVACLMLSGCVEGRVDVATHIKTCYTDMHITSQQLQA